MKSFGSLMARRHVDFKRVCSAACPPALISPCRHEPAQLIGARCPTGEVPRRYRRRVQRPTAGPADRPPEARRPLVREALTGAGVFAIGVPLTGIGVRQPAILIAAVAAVLVIGAQLGVLVGSYARSLDQVYAIETLLVLPLGFLCGIFYPVSQLPGPWRLASELNPAFYVVQSLRIGFLGSGDIPAGLALGVVYALAAALTGWSVLIFRSGSLLKP